MVLFKMEKTVLASTKKCIYDIIPTKNVDDAISSLMFIGCYLGNILVKLTFNQKKDTYTSDFSILLVIFNILRLILYLFCVTRIMMVDFNLTSNIFESTLVTIGNRVTLFFGAILLLLLNISAIFKRHNYGKHICSFKKLAKYFSELGILVSFTSVYTINLAFVILYNIIHAASILFDNILLGELSVDLKLIFAVSMYMGEYLAMIKVIVQFGFIHILTVYIDELNREFLATMKRYDYSKKQLFTIKRMWIVITDDITSQRINLFIKIYHEICIASRSLNDSFDISTLSILLNSFTMLIFNIFYTINVVERLLISNDVDNQSIAFIFFSIYQILINTAIIYGTVIGCDFCMIKV